MWVFAQTVTYELCKQNNSKKPGTKILNFRNIYIGVKLYAVIPQYEHNIIVVTKSKASKLRTQVITRYCTSVLWYNWLTSL